MTDTVAATPRPAGLLLAALLAAATACAAVAAGAVLPGPDRPVEGRAASTELADVVQRQLPDARHISYLEVQPIGIDIVDEVVAEFDLDGTTCTARVTGVRYGDEVTVAEPDCGQGLMAPAGPFTHIDRHLLGAGVILAVLGAVLYLASWATSRVRALTARSSPGGT